MKQARNDTYRRIGPTTDEGTPHGHSTVHTHHGGEGPHDHERQLLIPEDAWRSEGDGILMTDVVINQLPMHLLAIPVTVVDDEMMAAHEANTDWFNDLHGAFAADGKYQTVTIGDQEYALFADGYS